jgi:RimJ/RimL family protein N-acetyltransferase
MARNWEMLEKGVALTRMLSRSSCSLKLAPDSHIPLVGSVKEPARGRANPAAMSSSVAPVIETARLRLTAPALEDAEAIIAMWADPVVTAYISGEPMSRQQAWLFFSAMVGQWPLVGYGYWTVVERETGAFAGMVGFQRFVRPIAALPQDAPEAGWTIVPRSHGRGYASEAMNAALSWADANLSASRSVAIVNPENVASLRVGTKCGFAEIGRQMYRDHPIVLLERPRGAAGGSQPA